MKKKKAIHQTNRWRNRSVFWSYFIMMLCVLSVSVASLLLSSRLSKNALTQENLARLEASLDRNCETMNISMHTTSAIPKAIVGTRYYDYIRAEDGKTTSDKYKYTSVLPLIRSALNNQVFLKGDNEDCILYLESIDSIVTSSHCFIDADTCLNDHIIFSETTEQEILETLRTRSVIKLFPMQDVTIGQTTMRCMALAIRQRDISVGVLTIYNEGQILKLLGYDSLPEGSYLQIKSTDGNVLFSYPTEIDAAGQEKQYALEGKLSALNATVTLWIPANYSDSILKQATIVSTGLLIITVALGLMLCVLFSRASTEPLRRIVSTHMEEDCVQFPNEVEYLGNLIESTKEETKQLQTKLMSGLLVRVFSGSVLSETDEIQLKKHLSAVGQQFRVAILHTSGEADQTMMLGYLRASLPDEFFCEPINAAETGIIFLSDGTHLLKIQETLNRMEQEVPVLAGRVLCGISGQHEQLNSIHVAVRQAHIALPRNELIGIYSGSNSYSKTVSWLQHERFYQTILANDAEETVAHLKEIASNIYRGSAAREMFYNIRFVLRSAADEMELPFSEQETIEYDVTLLPRENMEHLEQMVHVLFRKIQDKQNRNQSSKAAQVLAYITEQYRDSELCITSVAEYFNVSERTIHTMVRSASGMTFNEYLQSLRMKKAADLLMQGKMRIGEIAERCGYQAESTFYRVFKKHYGITPNQYRADGGTAEKSNETQ